MKSILTVSMCMFIISGVATADIIRGIDIDFVTIGSPANPGDTSAGANPSGCGIVGYQYQIGMYEITNSQWDAFTLVSGAPTGNPSDAYNQSTSWAGAEVPANNVSWYEAVQFCNYLTSGDKSQGAYRFSGNNTNPIDFLGIDRDSAVSAYGTVFVIPTIDEWYKAAYYTGSGYSSFANGTDVAPIADDDTKYGSAGAQPWDVGSGTPEQNNTFDMMGNVWELNETLFVANRGYRGGAYNSNSGYLKSSSQKNIYPYYESPSIGFRVASVPEPCTLVLLSLGGALLLKRRKR